MMVFAAHAGMCILYTCPRFFPSQYTSARFSICMRNGAAISQFLGVYKRGCKFTGCIHIFLCTTLTTTVRKDSLRNYPSGAHEKRE